MAFGNQPDLKVQLSVVDTPLGDDPRNYTGILTFGGWNDITSDVRQVSIDRGRSNDLEKIGTGTASLLLSNDQRQYDPLNTNGPYYDSMTSTQWLRPRNQVRVFGVYPNDPTVDGFCYNMQNKTTRTPSAGVFSEGGYSLTYAVSGGVLVNLTSSLNLSSISTLTVLVHTELLDPDLYGGTGYWPLFQIPGFVDCYVDGNYITVDQDYGGLITVLGAFVEPFMETEPTWLKFVLTPTSAGRSISYCRDQYQVPTTWTDITDSTTSTLTFSGTKTQINLSSTYAFGDADYTGPLLKRLRVTGDSTQYLDLLCETHISLFQGYVSGWPQEYQMMGKDAVVNVSCFDNSGLLGNMKVPTDLLETLVPATTPWGWWRLGDASDICVDYSGSNHDLTYTPAGQFNHVTDVVVANGLSGIATTFAPSTTSPPYIASGHKAPVVAAQDFSLSLWFVTTQELYGSDTARLITFDNEVNLIIMRMSLFGGTTVENRQQSRLTFTHETYAGIATVNSGATQYVTDGLPHHAVVTYKASTGALKLYIDGVLASSTTSGLDQIQGGFISMGRSSPNVAEVNVLNFNGSMQDVVYWDNKELTATEVLNIFNAGNGYVDETSGARMGRILDYAGFPERLRNIDPDTYGTCGAVEYVEDQALLELMQKVEDTEVGILFTNRSGRLTLRGRYYLSMADTGINTQASFDDANTNIGYRNLKFSFDAEQLVNDHIVVDDVGAEYQSDDATSVTNYGRRSRSLNTLLNDTTAARNMAIGLTNIYKEPILKAEPFEIVPLQDEWMSVLPLDIGDRLNLKATPMGISPQINQDLALQSISYDIRPRTKWDVTVIGSPRPVISYFVLDKSELDGPDVLGF